MRIHEILAHARSQDLEFFDLPAGDAGQEGERVGLDGVDHVRLLVAADFFLFGVFGPGADWDLQFSHQSGIK
jgi:hypothetical protein